MSLRTEINPRDPRMLNIYSGAVLVGGVAHAKSLDAAEGPFQWFTCFASEKVFATSDTLRDAASAVAHHWRGWLDQATLQETSSDAQDARSSLGAFSDEDLRQALSAVHRALVMQRDEINRLRSRHLASAA